MRPKVDSATKKFLFDHVWGLPYNPRTQDAGQNSHNSPMKVLYLREKEGEVPRMCGSSALGSALSGSSPASPLSCLAGREQYSTGRRRRRGRKAPDGL